MSTTSTPPSAPAIDRAQDERDRVAKSLRRYADRRRGDHQAIVKARSEAVAMACGYVELDAMGEPDLIDEGIYSYEDVLSWLARALEMGAALPRIGGDTVEKLYRGDLVPNAIFREVLERRVSAGTASMKKVAERIDFIGGDDRNLQRLLGMETTPGSAGYPPTLRVFLTYPQAVAVAAVLELDPASCGV